MAKKSTGRPVGRPKGTRKAAVTSETLSFKVSAELKAQLQAYAKQRRQSISELIREGVEWRIGEAGDPLSFRYGTVASGETAYEENTGVIGISGESAGVLREVQASVARLEAQLQAVVQILEQRAVLGRSGGNTGNTENLAYAPPTPGVRAKSDKAKILVRLQQMHETGLDSTQIAAALEAEGTPTLSGKGQWHAGTVRKLLGAIK